jgi:membrane-associated phospholipid phosphatase
LTQIKRFLHARFSAEDVLGLHLTLGIVILLAASWLFAAIAEDVVNQEQLSEIDVEVTQAVQAYASRTLTTVMLVITHTHSTIGGILISSAIVAWFLRNRLKSWALAFSLSVGGGMLLNVSLKNLFQRARPTFDNPILTFTSYGFPSGHTMLATTLYGALCVFIISRVRSWFGRLLAFLVAAFLIGLVGFSRIYLGAHYLSDVLAAMVEGLAWLALCLTAVHTKRRWTQQRKTKADKYLETI